MDSHPGLISHAKEFVVYKEGTEKPKRGLEELREGLGVQGWVQRRIAGEAKVRRQDGQMGVGRDKYLCINKVTLT